MSACLSMGLAFLAVSLASLWTALSRRLLFSAQGDLLTGLALGLAAGFAALAALDQGGC